MIKATTLYIAALKVCLMDGFISRLRQTKDRKFKAASAGGAIWLN